MVGGWWVSDWVGGVSDWASGWVVGIKSHCVRFVMVMVIVMVMSDGDGDGCKFRPL